VKDLTNFYEVTETGCWQWTRAKSNGYGQLMTEGRHWMAHRYTYTHLVGPIPEGLDLDHLCRNRACVNPEHLEPVTHRENVLRGMSPAALRARSTHCKNGHLFDESTTVLNAKGQRTCRICNNEKQKLVLRRKHDRAVERLHAAGIGRKRGAA
jgi:hypothetical protein